MKPAIGVIGPDRTVQGQVEALQHMLSVPVLLDRCLVDAGVGVARTMLKAGAGVLLSRGSITHALRKADLGCPLIDLPVTGFDVTDLLHKAKQHSDRVGIIAFDNVIEGAQRIAPILGIELIIHRVESVADILRAVDSVHKAGIRVIVGGIVAVERARELGLSALLIHCSPDAVLGALREAESMVLALCRERELLARREVMLNSISEAVVLYDAEGRVIQANTQADALFGSLGGGPQGGGNAGAASFADFNGVAEAVRRGEQWNGELIAWNGVQYACRLNPVLHDGVNLGSVAIIQDLAFLQNLEARIRKKHFSQGNAARYTLDDLVCASAETRRLAARARNYAESLSTVVIQGESGTGKELFAHVMHTASPRQAGPFVAINCTALPETLLESELFGYAEGAFTGTRKGGKPGLFELAHKGTLFLDEIGEFPMSMQARLLRVLEEKAVRRLGQEALIPVDVRVVCATNRDLSRMVADGTFREDLFYRLNVLCLTIPPLRQNPRDLAALLDHFLKTLPPRLKRPALKLSPGAREELERYTYPGNAREMRNLVERLLVTCSGETISREAVRENLISIPRSEPRSGRAANSGKTALKPGAEPRSGGLLRREEDRLILEVMEDCGGNRVEAAKRLGLSPTTLWRRLQSLRRE